MSEPLKKQLSALSTEGPNPRTADLDLLDTEGMLRIMNAEDRSVAGAVGAAVPSIARVVDLATELMRKGGRLLYFGAGTSGRIGVLDASECPPTFGTPPELVRGIIAGGRNAMFDAVEGAEDDAALGRADVAREAVGPRDVVLALTASGRTPYALGVLEEGVQRGALTVAVACNKGSAVANRATVVLEVDTGEEVLSGSTRLKAGTAQKMILNMISTGVMIRLGRTYGNLMVGVVATNAKLRERARRLVVTIAQTSEGVDRALEASGYDVRVACVMLMKGVDVAEARARLAEAGGSLRGAL